MRERSVGVSGRVEAMGARAFLKLFSVLALVISCGEVPPAADVGFSIATLDMSPPDDLVCVSPTWHPCWAHERSDLYLVKPCPGQRID